MRFGLGEKVIKILPSGAYLEGVCCGCAAFSDGRFMYILELPEGLWCVIWDHDLPPTKKLSDLISSQY